MRPGSPSRRCVLTVAAALIVGACSTSAPTPPARSGPSGAISTPAPAADGRAAPAGPVAAARLQSAEHPERAAIADFSVADDMRTATLEIWSNGGALTAADASGRPLAISDGRIAVPLAVDATRSEKQVTSVVIRTGAETAGHIDIEYYSPAYYGALSVRNDGQFVLFSAIPRVPDLVGPPATDPGASLAVPDAAAWAAARKAGVVPAGSGDDALLGLYRLFDTENRADGRAECPSADTGHAQLVAVLAHRCWVWCTGYARILRDFLRTAGLPARAVTLDPPYVDLANGVRVWGAEAHASTEVWDGSAWVWVDPSFRIRRVLLDGKPLSIRETIAAHADPSVRARLSFVLEDPTIHDWVTESYATLDPVLKGDLARYLTTRQSLNVAIYKSDVP